MHPVRRNNKIYASDSENSGKITNTSSLLHPTVDNQRLLKAILKSPETKEGEIIISQLGQVRNSNNMGSLFSATGSDSVSSPLLCQPNSHHTANYSSIQLYQSDEIHIRKMFESGQEVATRVGYLEFLHTVSSYFTCSFESINHFRNANPLIAYMSMQVHVTYIQYILILLVLTHTAWPYLCAQHIHIHTSVRNSTNHFFYLYGFVCYAYYAGCSCQRIRENAFWSSSPSTSERVLVRRNK